MATLTSYTILDYADDLLHPATQGTLLTGTSSGPITVGQHRLIHISAKVNTNGANRCAISYTMGNSAATGGTPAPTPVNSSPFLLGDEGYIVDTGMYDQINLATLSAYNGASTIVYSVSLLSKFSCSRLMLTTI